MKSLTLVLACLVGVSLGAVSREKRDILPGDPRYGTDYHHHHHHHHAEGGANAGSYSAPAPVYGPPGYKPAAPYNARQNNYQAAESQRPVQYVREVIPAATYGAPVQQPQQPQQPHQHYQPQPQQPQQRPQQPQPRPQQPHQHYQPQPTQQPTHNVPQVFKPSQPAPAATYGVPNQSAGPSNSYLTPAATNSQPMNSYGAPVVRQQHQEHHHYHQQQQQTQQTQQTQQVNYRQQPQPTQQVRYQRPQPQPTQHVHHQVKQQPQVSHVRQAPRPQQVHHHEQPQQTQVHAQVYQQPPQVQQVQAYQPEVQRYNYEPPQVQQPNNAYLAPVARAPVQVSNAVNDEPAPVAVPQQFFPSFPSLPNFPTFEIPDISESAPVQTFNDVVSTVGENYQDFSSALTGGFSGFTSSREQSHDVPAPVQQYGVPAPTRPTESVAVENAQPESAPTHHNTKSVQQTASNGGYVY